MQTPVNATIQALLIMKPADDVMSLTQAPSYAYFYKANN